MVRPPAVAGRFYSDHPAELARQIAALAPPPKQPLRPALACVVPHAGYRYSGQVAGAVYAQLRLPRRFLLIGPRHFPRGQTQAILSEGAWQTPLGQLQIDSELARELKTACPRLCEDDVAHRGEHALEVQLPFLQCLAPACRFVPIALGPVNYPDLEFLGQAIAEVLRRQPAPVVLVASSDMNHYESQEITRRKDRLAIDAMLALDGRGLFDVVRRERISMCGFAAVVSVLTAARLLGARRATLVRYATSGDVTGDLREVVGYAGIIVE